MAMEQQVFFPKQLLTKIAKFEPREEMEERKYTRRSLVMNYLKTSMKPRASKSTKYFRSNELGEYIIYCGMQAILQAQIDVVN